MTQFRNSLGGSRLEYFVLTKVDGMIMGPISQVLGWIMNMLFEFTNMFGFMNIGLSIILFTIVVKIIMFPMTIKQQKSSKLMTVMQPEIQAIQNKYKGKTDQDSMMRQNVEIKAVYEKYGTSMTGGCLQLIIQMPILLALYRVIYTIPAYVAPVKEHFMNVVYAITGVTNASALTEGAASQLLDFAAAQNVPLTGMVNIGDLTGVAGEALGNKMVDLLYKLNPAQWTELANAFPSASAVIAENAEMITQMNSFFGINLASNPFNGSFIPNIAWIIPILAGLTQWYSSKLMMSNQPQNNNSEPNMGTEMMKQMNVVMPLMSVFFCFTFPAAVGVYWVASSVVMIIQQALVNSYLNKMDLDEMIKKNVEKANKKRAKQGLPPQKVNEHATASLKHMQDVAQREEAKRAEKLEKTRKQVEESNQYYNKDAKPGSLAAKANMVAKYNEKHNK